MTPTSRWVSAPRLHTILGQIVAYPAGDHRGGDTEERKTLRLAATAARESLSPVEQLERMLHPWVGFVIFTMALFIARLAFEPSLMNAAKLGILSASIIAVVAGLALLAWLSPRREHLQIAHTERMEERHIVI